MDSTNNRIIINKWLLDNLIKTGVPAVDFAFNKMSTHAIFKDLTPEERQAVRRDFYGIREQ